MPLNGSGVASIPVVFTPGTPILASEANLNFSDIAVMINNLLPRDGQAPMTGIFLSVSGVEGAPGIAFDGDPDTGIWRSGPDAFALVTGGSARLAVGNSGATVSGDLAVSGAESIGGNLTVDGILSVQAPPDLWSNDYVGIGGLGGLYTQGSFYVSLTGNGYRNSSGEWTSLAANGNTGAAVVGLDPAGAIRFHVSTDWPTGSNPSPPTAAVIEPAGAAASDALTVMTREKADARYSRTTIAASAVTSGTFAADRIPNLNASKVTAGTFADARIPNLNASKINAGTFADARIPNLNASKVTAGTFAAARIPNLNASLLTSGTVPVGRLGTDDNFRNWVLSRTAGAATGAVGTYGTFRCESAGRPVSAGSTRSGSVLAYSNSAASFGASPAGTWRCMGEIGSADSSSTFLRINNPVILGHRGPYRYVSGGRIDCEVEFAEHGYVPCTLAPDDAQTAPLFAEIEADPGITPEPYVEPEPEEPSLTREQWDYMLAIGGLRTPIRAVLDAIDAAADSPEARAAFADLERAVLHSQRYRLSNILAMVEAHAGTIEAVLGDVPTEQQITAAFNAALEA